MRGRVLPYLTVLYTRLKMKSFYKQMFIGFQGCLLKQRTLIILIFSSRFLKWKLL